MNSLSALLPNISSELGIEIIALEDRQLLENPYRIRFAELDVNKSFSLKLTRSWKTTIINFEPDPFAGEVVKYLCGQLNLKCNAILGMIKNSNEVFSNIILKVDQKPFISVLDELSDNPKLEFSVEVLTAESALDYGLVNEQEENLIRFTLKLFASLLPIREVSFRNADEVLGFPEASVSKVLVNKYERDPRNRKLAIELHGRTCMACGFNFLQRYGAIGDGYIVVHHVVPLSKLNADYVIDPGKDLVTLCANCHAMAHQCDPPLSVIDLRKLLLG
jgi:5-methylcytosine-specific restriction protein A